MHISYLTCPLTSVEPILPNVIFRALCGKFLLADVFQVVFLKNIEKRK